VDARESELRQAGEQRRAKLQQRADAVDSKDGSAVPTGDDVAKALRVLQDEMPAPMTLVDEAIWDQDSFHQFVHFDAPNSYFNAQGGSLGVSMPASIGAKLAAGDGRTIVNTVGDGTALFYPHSWWTTRKFNLPILYIVTNNREYKTLLAGRRTIMKVYDWKPAGDDWFLRLEDPPMSFVALAKPFGIEGTLVESVAQLEGALRQGLEAVKGGQPFVVEVLVDPALPPPAETPTLTGPP
jgi:benzoylformate decarboxylase